MKIFITLLLALSAVWLQAQSVVDFENYNLPPNSFLNGSDGGGGFTGGNVFLPNEYNSQWQSWSGWAISNVTDASTPGFTNQYSAIAGGGCNGSAHYAVTYAGGNNNLVLQGSAAGNPIAGMYITNNAYAYWSMRDGDAFSKKFGGLTGNDPDYFLLTIRAYLNGVLSTNSVDFYLADYRFANNSQDYIVDDWAWVNLSSLGGVDSLLFTLTSSDMGVFGMNTPAYFCVDDIFAANPVLVANSLPIANLFAIYPNPTADYLQITPAASANEIVSCLLFDLNGKLILQKQLAANGGQLDLQCLAPGNYVLHLQGAQTYATQLLVKQ